MWECGLKLCYETGLLNASMSLLMWECGLKLLGRDPKRAERQVTPYVGVWIETLELFKSPRSVHVTPYVGVWIETSHSANMRLACRCHSLCGSVD